MTEWRDRVKGETLTVDYRAPALAADDAASVLVDPHATRDERAGAALALRVSGEEPARIRVAASASADDDLRVTLEEIAEADPADDAAIEKALRRVARR